ncbi:hypothetical protein PJ985_22885 [Streptomyces sp. ACA25]|nr:hypothetical protein [Streptomyces sp. ACA25]MDB1090398.1 hypothetical protein [Streptomyces sp. ACA25]
MDAPGETEPDVAAAPETAEVPGLPDEGPQPLGVALLPTGHGEVDARLSRLTEADHLAVPAHLEVYEDVHSGLRETLAALDQRPGPPPAAPPEPRS